MTGLRLVGHQSRYDLLTFVRDPAATFFTLALPIIFLVLFVTLFGDERLDSGLSTSTYYVPGIVALAIISANLFNMAIGLTELREAGMLKRLRGTPLPPRVFIASRMAGGAAVGLVMTAILLLLGRVLYGVAIPGTAMVGFVLALLVGSATFSALGIAMTAVIPSLAAAPPIANAVTLPLFFVSGIFVPSEQTPDWMQKVADAFPVKPLSEALLTAFDPATSGLGIAWAQLAVVAAWGIGGALIAARTFRWVPR